jgi:hypothetical protein
LFQHTLVVSSIVWSKMSKPVKNLRLRN